MGKVIAVVNQKGGVGKTTSCINLCCALSESGRRTLLCDMDPQGNSTSGMGIDKNSVYPTIYDVVINGADPVKAIISTPYGYVMPSNKALSGAGVELVGVSEREFCLQKAVNKIKDDYDYIIIDCPPSLELLTLNGLCAADTLLVPVQCEYFALEGLSDLLTTLKIIKKRLNTALEIEGVLLTMYDGRTNLSLQVAEEVKKYFKAKVFRTVIPRNVRLSEAPSYGKPAIVYDRSSRGSRAYAELAEEIIKNNRGV